LSGEFLPTLSAKPYNGSQVTHCIGQGKTRKQGLAIVVLVWDSQCESTFQKINSNYARTKLEVAALVYAVEH